MSLTVSKYKMLESFEYYRKLYIDEEEPARIALLNQVDHVYFSTRNIVSFVFVSIFV